MNQNGFPNIEFTGKLRPTQQEVVEIARQQLNQGKRNLHVVAPPGSGKTVLGLYLWAELIKQPCLVLSPNSAIQSQWAARIDLFRCETDDVVSTDPQQPSFLTSLTYQSVTMPARKHEEVQRQAIDLWADKLIEAGEVSDRTEAIIWIDDLKANNPDYFNSRLSSSAKKVRDEISIAGDSLQLLHPSSLATLKRISKKNVGVLILDECHHLVGHWGRVLAGALEMLGNPIVIGLTATPPDTDNKDARDVERYEKFFGPIDYEVPVPAIVKDGFLAPYQDLAYFVRPTSDELKFVASADQQLDELIERLCQNETNQPSEEADLKPKDLISFLIYSLASFQLPTGRADSWSEFARRDPALSLCARQFLTERKISLPKSCPPLSSAESSDVPKLNYWVPVLDRYVRHHLRRSSDPQLQQLAKDVVRSLRLLGIQITDTGTRACSSAVSRVLAYSANKAAAVIPILVQEMESLGDGIRAVIVSDFERASAVSAELKELMDVETGGAIAAFKTLLTNEKTDSLEPVLATGSTILIDDEIEKLFLDRSRQWLADRNLTVKLESKVVLEFRQIIGSGADWSPRVYIELITHLFQEGLTRCLVGTRGLLGEGWDANKINVLIDLTTVTTSMSINQLRGRSFRLDPSWSTKLANNWDVVCLAPEFKKGFDDYHRFIKKHCSLYGVTDDGAIEKGVGHVHPAFTEIEPEGLEESATVLNAEMLARSAQRTHSRDLWKIGDPYLAAPVRAVELKASEGMGGFPPFRGSNLEWNAATLTRAIAEAVLASLVELKLITSDAGLHDGKLAGGYIRFYIENANDEENELFSTALSEVMGPIENPRYVIQRYIHQRTNSFFARLLPEILARYFRSSKNELVMLHVVPSVLAKNKERVQVFRKHWNSSVSPGEAIFAQRGEGAKVVEHAKIQGLQPNVKLHEKEVYL